MARRISNQPRLIDSRRPQGKVAQDMSSVDKHSKGTESYKSPAGGSSGSAGDINDTNAGDVRQLKRSTPVAGIYQSEGQNRGGPMTKNYDAGTDKDCTFTADGLDALRAKQDAAKGKGEED